MNELEHINCPLCDSTNHQKLLTGKDYLFSQEKFTIVRCDSCGLLFTNPRVKEDQISFYYYPDYSPYKEVKQSRFYQKVKNRLGRLLGNTHWEILQILQSIRAKTVLEIGPGNGSLLYFLRHNGFEVAGVETDESCVTRIREKDIICYQGDLKDVREVLNNFDAVILCQVFEHLYHPKETLKYIYNILTDNGIVYLSIPNSSSMEAKLFGRYWRGLDLPRHVVHYNMDTIRGLLTEMGFKIRQIDNIKFPSSFIESIAIRFFRKGQMPNKCYYALYYFWKLLGPIHCRLFGSGVMRVIAQKKM